jgi:hypothetical protein
LQINPMDSRSSIDRRPQPSIRYKREYFFLFPKEEEEELYGATIFFDGSVTTTFTQTEKRRDKSSTRETTTTRYRGNTFPLDLSCASSDSSPSDERTW